MPPDVVGSKCNALLSLPVEPWISHFSKMYRVSVCGIEDGLEGNSEPEWNQMCLFPDPRTAIIFDPKHSHFDSMGHTFHFFGNFF